MAPPMFCRAPIRLGIGPHSSLLVFIEDFALCTKVQILKYVSKSNYEYCNKSKLEMWANAQRDDRPAEYRWRHLFNAAKFAWRPLLECHAVMLLRCETCWNFQGCPKLVNRSQPLVGRSTPYYQDMWRRHCSLTIFFPIVDKCLSCEDIAWKSCAKVPRWRFFGDFCVLYYQRASCSTFQTCILNSH